MQCNDCSGDVEQFLEDEKTSHDPDKDAVVRRLYQCTDCGMFGREYEDMGQTQRTGVIRNE